MQDGYRVGWAECYQCKYRWIVITEPGYLGVGLACPECDAVDGWMVRYIDPPTARELLHWDADARDDYMRATAAHAAKLGYPDDDEVV